MKNPSFMTGLQKAKAPADLADRGLVCENCPSASRRGPPGRRLRRCAAGQTCLSCEARYHTRLQRTSHALAACSPGDCSPLRPEACPKTVHQLEKIRWQPPSYFVGDLLGDSAPVR